MVCSMHLPRNFNFGYSVEIGMLLCGNVMAVIETECVIYCCRSKHYNLKDGLLIFNVSRTVDFYVRLLSWKDLGYEETDMLP